MTRELSGQVLRFQRNNYTTSLAPAIRDIRSSGLFHDLTLVTSDNQLVTAHKIVLAACSAFFKGNVPVIQVTSHDLNVNLFSYTYPYP